VIYIQHEMNAVFSPGSSRHQGAAPGCVATATAQLTHLDRLDVSHQQRACCRCSAGTAQPLTSYCPAGDEVHFFHVVSPPHAEVIGGFGGVGGVDELIAAEPDPAADRVHVRM
jgi:hypothetical protein